MVGLCALYYTNLSNTRPVNNKTRWRPTFIGIEVVGLTGIQMSFEYLTIWRYWDPKFIQIPTLYLNGGVQEKLIEDEFYHFENDKTTDRWFRKRKKEIERENIF